MLIIAKIPAFTAAGSLFHAATTMARSSGMSDTYMTHLLCKRVVCDSCEAERREDSRSIQFCAICVSVTSYSCVRKHMPKGGFEPPTLRQRLQHQRITNPTSSTHFHALPVESQHALTPESHPIHSAVRESCAPSVPENSASLIALIEACAWLSPEVRNQLVVILRTSRKR